MGEKGRERTHDIISPSDVRQQVVMAMIFSGASAFAMSYASAWCVRTTSSTTYSMVGALNKLPIAASGILFFGDPATFGNITAIIVGKTREIAPGFLETEFIFLFFFLFRFYCRYCLFIIKDSVQQTFTKQQGYHSNVFLKSE